MNFEYSFILRKIRYTKHKYQSYHKISFVSQPYSLKDGLMADDIGKFLVCSAMSQHIRIETSSERSSGCSDAAIILSIVLGYDIFLFYNSVKSIKKLFT